MKIEKTIKKNAAMNETKADKRMDRFLKYLQRIASDCSDETTT